MMKPLFVMHMMLKNKQAVKTTQSFMMKMVMMPTKTLTMSMMVFTMIVMKTNTGCEAADAEDGDGE